MFQTVVRRPLTWLLALAALVTALAMSAGYLGAFLGPESNVHDFPIGIVNSDAGVSVMGQTRNTGDEMMATILADDSPTSGKVEWHVYDNREDLTDALEANEVYAGIVIPESFTQDLAGIIQPQLVSNQPQQATIEVLYNHGGGSIAASNAKNITSQVIGRVQALATEQVQGSISTDSIPVESLNLYSNPVNVVETDLVPAVAHTGAGMAPIYFSIVVTVGGLLAASIVNMGIDFMAGHAKMGPRLERMRGDAVPAGLKDMYLLKVVLLLAVSVIGGVLSTLFATQVLDMPVSNVWTLMGLAIVGMLAAGGPTLAFISMLGTPGILLGLLLTTILGVPSTGGVFPHALMPRFYEWFGSIAPVRYLYNAVRSVVFFDGRGAAGLSTWWVVVLWAFAGLIVGYVVTVIVDRSRSVDPEPTPAD